MPHTTRQRLVETARDLFWEDGYGATPISKILEISGVNAGSLYHFFPTKRDLLLAVLDWYLDQIGPVLLDPAFDGVDDPIEKVFALLERYRGMLIEDDFQHGCPIGNLALELGDCDDEIRARIAANFTGWVAAVQACFDEVGDRLPDDLDRHALAVHVLTVMEGAVMQARAQRSIEPFDGSVAQLRDYVDRLLADAGVEEAAARSS